MNKKLVLVVAIVAVLVLGVGGGLVAALVVGDGDDSPSTDADPTSRSTEPAATPDTDTPTTAAGPVPEGLEEFYSQQLAWEDCGGNECAALTVPVDYLEPDGDTVDLKIERVPAGDQADRIGSVVVNPGGPGAPGTTMAENATGYFRSELLDRVDIVAFDPRGTGESDPVDCLDDADLDAFVAQDPAPDDAAEGEEITANQDEFFAGCVASSDSLIGHVSTVEAARDMDVLRAALGEEKLSYLGFSYGTTLGSTYAELYPGNVGRFVLDGATDPTLDFRDNALSQAAGFQTALDAYVDDCVDGGDCFLGDSREAGLATIEDLLADIEKSPLPTNQDRDLEAGNALYGLITPLYSRDSWSYLDQALEEALDGSGSTLLLLSDLYGSRNASGGYDDNSLEAILAINCLDDPSSIEPADVPAEFPAFDEASPTFGRVFAWGLIGCHGIQVEAAEPTPIIDGEGAAPIVVVGTTRDPATPYEEAVALAEQLDSGVLLTRDGDGHTGYNKGNSCIDEAVEGYLIDGTVPEDGTEC
ncbi:alpha/beta hydrolase [Nocardioides sp.]|uniref:alpha/beta hydrolase n=1 Tax=Nocardioides sp. TaxID=35761 RepID=UPI002727FE44|nr:alpha/beta hydrolase [Nocardioides sp.]MDO9454793.1 alpha/beta hydrolase [Nocardioides sp.]